MINEYDDSADNFATFLMNHNDNDDVFLRWLFQAKCFAAKHFQRILSTTSDSASRRFFGGSKPVDPLRFQFECICAGYLSVIGFSWIQQGRIYMRSKTVVVGLDLKNQWCVLWSHTAHIECQKVSIQVKVREKKMLSFRKEGLFGKNIFGHFLGFPKERYKF